MIRPTIPSFVAAGIVLAQPMSPDDVNRQLSELRALGFNYLPFYHMGVQMSLAVNDWHGINYWLVNGVNQAEDFNGLKDQLFGFTAQLHKSVTWQFNYFLGYTFAIYSAGLNPYSGQNHPKRARMKLENMDGGNAY